MRSAFPRFRRRLRVYERGGRRFGSNRQPIRRERDTAEPMRARQAIPVGLPCDSELRDPDPVAK